MTPADLTDLVIRKFDPQTATTAEFKALNAFVNLIRREGWPSESTTKWDEMERSKRFLPSFAERHLWAAWQGRIVLGLATLDFAHTNHNCHIANFMIEVHPVMRRRGVARELLQRVADAARYANRRLLITWTSSLVPAGAAFMEGICGHMALSMCANQLDMRQLNRPLMLKWLARGSELESELELGFWDGAYPEDDLEAIAEMHEVMNTMPRGDLEVEDESWTCEQLRELEATLRNQGTERWTVYARCRATGMIAGYTQTFWNHSQPAILNQGDTGVFPAWRKRGLGTWLKAEMIERVLRSRPEVQRIRTWNAASNEPMIRINQQLGFRVQHDSLNWQVSLQQVEAYLAASRC
ncbi:MAG TPA: GNAT family N-acetyltransferase [Dehalococcoidia bacterium]|nr:GNAT family N-acetyltransferase [Dehalococcoidia bacterium]